MNGDEAIALILDRYSQVLGGQRDQAEQADAETQDGVLPSVAHSNLLTAAAREGAHASPREQALARLAVDVNLGPACRGLYRVAGDDPAMAAFRSAHLPEYASARGELQLEVLRDADFEPREAIGRLQDDLPTWFDGTYCTDVSARIWEDITAAVSVARSQRMLRSPEASISELQAIIATGLAESEQLAARIRSRVQHWSGGTGTADLRPSSQAELDDLDVVVLDLLSHEVTYGSPEATARLIEEGVVSSAAAAVESLIGLRPVAAVLAFTEERWLTVGRGDQPGGGGEFEGAHGLARPYMVVISATVAQRARDDHAAGKLNRTLVHELIHSTQSEGYLLTWPEDPGWYGRCEEALREGTTDALSLRLAGGFAHSAATPPQDDEADEALPRPMEVLLVEAVSEAVCPGDPGGFLVELNRSECLLDHVVRTVDGRLTPETRSRVAEALNLLAERAEEEVGRAASSQTLLPSPFRRSNFRDAEPHRALADASRTALVHTANEGAASPHTTE